MENFKFRIEQNDPMIEQLLVDSAYRTETYILRVAKTKQYSKIAFFFPMEYIDSPKNTATMNIREYRKNPTFCIAQDSVFSDQWFANGEEAIKLYENINEIEWEEEEVEW